ncbi:MAG UNVERIFIED_CONTAM: hypothetical protein LVR18_15175 [Planctomycetaceae bacterium]
MSFNIRYGTARDGVNAWPNRRQHVVSVIQTFSPDLLGTQETLPFQAQQLQQDLAGYQYIGWSRDASRRWRAVRCLCQDRAIRGHRVRPVLAQ